MLDTLLDAASLGRPGVDADIYASRIARPRRPIDLAHRRSRGARPHAVLRQAALHFSRLSQDPGVQPGIDIPPRHDDRPCARRAAPPCPRAPPPARPRRPARRRSADGAKANAIAAAISRLADRDAARAWRRAARRRSAARPVWSAARRSGSAARGSATGTIAPPASERAMSSQPSGSTVTTCASGSASAIPAESPPPPQRHQHHVGRPPAELGHLLGDLDADAALPLDHVDIVERGHQGRAAARARAARRSPRGSRSRGRRGRSRRRPQGRVALHRRRVGRHHDRRGDAQPPRRQRDALGMVARRESDDAARPLVCARAASAGWSRRAA